MINEHDILRIADFGLARLFNPEDSRKCYSPQVATRWYRAPEILWGAQIYGPSIDIFSAGCVFAEMLRGVPLFAVKYIYFIEEMFEIDDFVMFREILILNSLHLLSEHSEVHRQHGLRLKIYQIIIKLGNLISFN